MSGQLSSSSENPQEEIHQGLAQKQGGIDEKSYVLRLVTNGQRSAEAESVVYDYLIRDGNNTDKKDILLAMVNQQEFLDRVLAWGKFFIKDPTVAGQEKMEIVSAVLSKLETQGVERKGYSISDILRQEDIVSADKKAVIEKILRINRYSLTRNEQVDSDLGVYLEQDTVSTSDKADVLRQVLSEDYRNMNAEAFKRYGQEKSFSLDQADDMALIARCVSGCINGFPPIDTEPIIYRLLDSEGVSNANKLKLVEEIGHSEEVDIDFKIDLVKTALYEREWGDNELIRLAAVACRQYKEGLSEKAVRDRCSLIFSMLSPALIDEKREQKIKVVLLGELIAQDVRLSRGDLEEEAKTSYLHDERIIKLFPLAINHIATGSQEGIYLEFGRTGLRISTNQNALMAGTLRSVKVQKVFLSVMNQLMPELPRERLGAYLDFIWSQRQNSNRQVQENKELKEAITKVPWFFSILRKDDPLRVDYRYIEQLSQQAGVEIEDLLDRDMRRELVARRQDIDGSRGQFPGVT